MGGNANTEPRGRMCNLRQLTQPLCLLLSTVCAPGMKRKPDVWASVRIKCTVRVDRLEHLPRKECSVNVACCHYCPYSGEGTSVLTSLATGGQPEHFQNQFQ